MIDYKCPGLCLVECGQDQILCKQTRLCYTSGKTPKKMFTVGKLLIKQFSKEQQIFLKDAYGGYEIDRTHF